MEWIILVVSSMFEVSVMVNLEKSNGFRDVKHTVLAIVSQIIGLYLLSQTLSTLPLNVAYAAWTGLGTIGSLLYGVFFLKEDKNIYKFIFMSFIIVGIVGLKIFSG